MIEESHRLHSNEVLGLLVAKISNTSQPQVAGISFLKWLETSQIDNADAKAADIRILF